MDRPWTNVVVSDSSEVVATILRALDGAVARPCERYANLTELQARAGLSDVALIIIHKSSAQSGNEIAEFVRAVQLAEPALPVIVICDDYRPAQILELMRAGVADCLSRPIDLVRLGVLAEIVTARRCLAAPPLEVASDAPAPTTLTAQIQKIAARETAVLLCGETGTGKTWLAQRIHELSAHASGPFVTVHCGTLTPSLIESELFGYVRGAFTGAADDSTGWFGQAGKGTLFIDEIDSVPLPLQAKFLRVLDNREYVPVGSKQTMRLNARTIVATNRKLESEVAAGRFRQDLYFRLNVARFEIAALRDRADDILGLAESFLQEFAAREQVAIRGFSADVSEFLAKYHWPGNIRELRNLVERAVSLCTGAVIETADLPKELLESSAEAPGASSTVVSLAAGASQAGAVATNGNLAHSMEAAEQACIAAALARNRHNKLKTANQLGISRMTLYKKLHKYGFMLD